MSLMARTGVHKSKRVGGLDTRPERDFFRLVRLTPLGSWAWLRAHIWFFDVYY